MNSDAPRKYVQLTGVSHSGTTLLAFLLNAHPKMVSLAEMSPAPFVDITKYSCSCGEPFLYCPFLRKLEAHVQQTVPAFTLEDWRTRFRPTGNMWLDKALVGNLYSNTAEGVRDGIARLIPGLHRDINDRVTRISAVANAACELANAEVYVDSTKNPRRPFLLRRSEEIDLHVIHMVKDVRQGVTSSMKRELGDAQQMAKHWQRGNKSAARTAAAVAPDRFLRIRYHEFAAEPQATVDRVAEFVGVPSAPIPENFFDSEHHIIGNRMRLRGGGRIRNDESWKEALSDEELAQIDKIAGTTNRHFGFSWPEGSK